MPIIRTDHHTGFTVLSNHAVQDERLSLKARGLLAYMLSMPDDWQFSNNGLEASFPDGMVAIKSTVKELVAAGYLHIEKMFPRKGQKRIEYVWTVSEQPQGVCSQEVENIYLVKSQEVCFQAVENRTQQNTNIQNTHSTRSARAERIKHTFGHESNPYKAARWLADQIETRLMGKGTPYKEADLQRWADDFDKCHRLDGHSWDEIESVLAFATRDEFWQKNIMSGAKFRKQYNRLLDRMGGGTK